MKDDKKKCAHPGCNCSPPEGEKYCSTYCHDARESLELHCGCGHPGCEVSSVESAAFGGAWGVVSPIFARCVSFPPIREECAAMPDLPGQLPEMLATRNRGDVRMLSRICKTSVRAGPSESI